MSIAHREAKGMNQPAGTTGHQGVLVRGADGSLWFMRDDWNAPKRLDQATTDKINQLTANLYQQKQFTYPLPQVVIDVLDGKYPPIQPDGVIHHVATGGP